MDASVQDLGLLVSIGSNSSVIKLKYDCRLRAGPQIWNHSIQGGCLLAGQAPWVKKMQTVGSDKLIDANRCAKVNITKVIKVQFTIYGNFG